MIYYCYSCPSLFCSQYIRETECSAISHPVGTWSTTWHCGQAAGEILLARGELDRHWSLVLILYLYCDPLLDLGL